jgi:hypothetical protein
MNAPLLTLFSQASQQGPSTGDVVGAVWLGLTILGIISIIVVGFTAKKINNISNPSYAKAFVAQLLIGPLSLAALALFGLYFQAPPVVAFAMAYSIIPIALYKIVFSCMWREAALIWIVATVVMGGVSYLLFLVGLLSFATPAAA